MVEVKVCVLGSGSRGNCILVRTSGTAVLIDAGFSAAETKRRLEATETRPEDIAAVLVGHEHLDHVRGLDVIARKWKTPVFMNRGSAEPFAGTTARSWNLRVFQNGYPFELGDFVVTPFSVVHDARDPVGFTLETRGIKVFVATDLGRATLLVRERLRGARIAVLEANHDRELLLNGSRPWKIKQRIKSGQGHLSNEDAGRLLAEEGGSGLADVLLAHLSQDCNRPELALQEIGGRLKAAMDEPPRLHLTFQGRISPVVAARQSGNGKEKTAASTPDRQLRFIGGSWV